MKTNNGFALAEVLMSAFVATLLVTFIAVSVTRNRNVSTTVVNPSERCQANASNLMARITNMNNTMLVRSWMPLVNARRPNANNNDPYCNTLNGRTAVCDQTDTFQPTTLPTYINPTHVRMALNIRGAASWAQSVYNYNKPAICTGNGISLTPAQLQQLLPVQSNLPTDVVNANLFIAEDTGGIACNNVASNLSINSSTAYVIRLLLNYQTQQGPNSCVAEGKATFPVDASPAKPDIVVRDGGGVIIPEGGCVVAPSSLSLTLTSNEPGVVFLCNKLSPVADTFGAGNYVPCGEMTLAGITPTLAVPAADPVYTLGSYTVVIDYAAVPARAEPHILTVLAVDGAVQSNPAKAIPVVRTFSAKATCP